MSATEQDNLFKRIYNSYKAKLFEAEQRKIRAQVAEHARTEAKRQQEIDYKEEVRNAEKQWHELKEGMLVFLNKLNKDAFNNNGSILGWRNITETKQHREQVGEQATSSDAPITEPIWRDGKRESKYFQSTFQVGEGLKLEYNYIYFQKTIYSDNGEVVITYPHTLTSSYTVNYPFHKPDTMIFCYRSLLSMEVSEVVEDTVNRTVSVLEKIFDDNDPGTHRVG